MLDTQFKKGALEMCVLAALSKKDYYGYELVNEISKTISISEGTIYPLMRRLRADEYVETYIQESTDGPPRKYYRLTQIGKKAADEMTSEWLTFNENINKLLKGATEK